MPFNNGELDLYLEYTGTGLQVILAAPQEVVQEINTDADAVYEYVKKEFKRQYGIDWLKPIGFNNTYAVMMRAETMEKYGLQKISDLAKKR